MPQTRKHTVVIASILKPVDDVRGYEKVGRSLADSGLYTVHVIGSNGSTGSPAPNIHFHTIGKFHRLSWGRWSASFRVLGTVRKLRPELLIVSTHELAVIAVYAKVFMRTKIVYDIQENYLLNILHTNAFPTLFRWPLALYVRAKEIVCSRFFDLFLLAEKVYEHQLAFARKRSVVIENKALIPDDFQRKPGPGIELLFSGTLAESTGVFEAIRQASMLHSEDESVRLHIIGFCSNSNDRARLSREVKGRPYISLNSTDGPQPHALIMQAISTASFGVVCYPRSPHTEGAVPTKVYEYLACRLPVLVTDQWAAFFYPYDAAVAIGPTTSAKALIDILRTRKFYSRDPDCILWQDEERKLLMSVSTLANGAGLVIPNV